MPTYTETWDETKPAGTRDRSLGDDDIREFKRAIRERLNEDHVQPSDETGYTTVGYHRKLTLIKQGSNATAVTDTFILFCKNDGSTDELFSIDESGNVCQITRQGKIKLAAGRLENNTYLVARNAAGSADIDMIKIDGSNLVAFGAVVTLPDTSAMASAAAPVANAQIANKKYVDDQIATIPAQVGLGTASNKSIGTVYQAATDGFVVASMQVDNGDTWIGYTDGSNPPTTEVQRNYTGSGTTAYMGTMCFPVKKNNYYKIDLSAGSGSVNTYYFISLGS